MEPSRDLNPRPAIEGSGDVDFFRMDRFLDLAGLLDAVVRGRDDEDATPGVAGACDRPPDRSVERNRDRAERTSETRDREPDSASSSDPQPSSELAKESGPAPEARPKPEPAAAGDGGDQTTGPTLDGLDTGSDEPGVTRRPERPAEMRPGDKLSRDKSAEEKAPLDRPSPDKNTSALDGRGGERSALEKPVTDKAVTDKGAADRPGAEKGAADKVCGDRSALEKGAGDRAAPPGDKGVGDKALADKGAGDKTIAPGDKGAGDKAVAPGDRAITPGDRAITPGDKGAGDKTLAPGDKALTEKGSGDKGDKAVADRGTGAKAGDKGVERGGIDRLAVERVTAEKAPPRDRETADPRDGREGRDATRSDGLDAALASAVQVAQSVKRTVQNGASSMLAKLAFILLPRDVAPPSSAAPLEPRAAVDANGGRREDVRDGAAASARAPGRDDARGAFGRTRDDRPTPALPPKEPERNAELAEERGLGAHAKSVKQIERREGVRDARELDALMNGYGPEDAPHGVDLWRVEQADLDEVRHARGLRAEDALGPQYRCHGVLTDGTRCLRRPEKGTSYCLEHAGRLDGGIVDGFGSLEALEEIEVLPGVFGGVGFDDITSPSVVAPRARAGAPAEEITAPDAPVLGSIITD